MPILNICVASKTVSIQADEEIISLIKINMSNFVVKKPSKFLISITRQNNFSVKIISKNNIALEIDDLTPLKSYNSSYIFNSDYINQIINPQDCSIKLNSDNYLVIRNAIRLCFMIWFKDLFPVHGAGIVNNNKGYIFSGPPGAGKSTIARRFDYVLNDEFVFISNKSDNIMLHGTPFGGELTPKNESVPLEKIFFIYQSKHTTIDLLSKKDTFLNLIQNNHLFFRFKAKDMPGLIKDIFNKGLSFSNIPAYKLGVSLDEDCWVKINGF